MEPAQTMTEITVRLPARAGEVFAPDAFDLTVGTIVPLRLAGRIVLEVELTAAEVTADGTAAVLTLKADR
jgi:hypothetical protein